MEIVLSNLQEKMTVTPALEQLLISVLKKTAELYEVEAQAEVGVVLVDDSYIRQLNRDYRDKDYSTDVLSFALQEGDEPEIIDGPAENLLGDIVLSLETALRQANEYGHSLEREVAFLTVHGMLHLLGYDHEEEADRRQMRQEEEFVLQHLGLARDA